MRTKARSSPASRAARVASLSVWLFGVWVPLMWSPFTLEQEATGPW